MGGDADQVAKTEEEHRALCDAIIAAEGRLRPLNQIPEDLRRNPVWSRAQCNRKQAPAGSAARSSSPPPIAISVRFVSCGELPRGICDGPACGTDGSVALFP